MYTSTPPKHIIEHGRRVHGSDASGLSKQSMIGRSASRRHGIQQGPATASAGVCCHFTPKSFRIRRMRGGWCGYPRSGTKILGAPHDAKIRHVHFAFAMGSVLALATGLLMLKASPSSTFRISRTRERLGQSPLGCADPRSPTSPSCTKLKARARGHVTSGISSRIMGRAQ